VDDFKTKAELANIITSLEHAEARLELANFDSSSKFNCALEEVRNALAAARLAAAAFGIVPVSVRH